MAVSKAEVSRITADPRNYSQAEIAHRAVEQYRKFKIKIS